MKSNRIAVGQRLKVLVPKDKLAYYRKINGMTAMQKRNLDKTKLIAETKPASAEVKDKVTVKTASTGSTASAAEKLTKVEYYIVQKGDTLWSIAQRYPGVTVADIMRVNGIK